MIDVDSAVGSADLEPALRAAGLPTRLVHLESADIAFTGRGEKGAPLKIGIEVKKIGELVTSLQTERLQGHQLLKMHKEGGYDRCYLIVQGDFQHDSQGRGFTKVGFAVNKKGIPNAVALEERLFNLQTRGGLITRHVPTKRDVVRVIQAWYRYWTDKDLDEHKSHLAVYAPDLDPQLKEPVTVFREMVARLPGVGYEASKALDDYFDGAREGAWGRFMRATVAEVAEIMTVSGKGKMRRIGVETAKRIREALR